MSLSWLPLPRLLHRPLLAFFLAGAGCSSSEQPPEGSEAVGGTGGTAPSSGGQMNLGGDAGASDNLGSGGSGEVGGGGEAGGHGETGGSGAGAGTGAGGSDASTGGAAGTGSTDTGGAAGSGGGPSEDPPAGTYIYVGSGARTGEEPGLVTAYAFDRDQKTLSFVNHQAAGGLASYLAWHPAGPHLFATDERNGAIITFPIDPATGGLGEGVTVTTGRAPVQLFIADEGRHLLVANYDHGSVDVFPVVDGELRNLASTNMLGASPRSIVADEEGRIWVALPGSNAIGCYALDLAEQLQPRTPATVAYDSPAHLFLQSGYLHVISQSTNRISKYLVEQQGALSLYWDNARVPEGTSGFLATRDAGTYVQASPSGSFVYGANRGQSNTIIVRSGLDGEPIAFEGTRGAEPLSFAVDPLEEFVIVANRIGKTLALFEIESDGTLTHQLTLDVPYSPFFVGAWHF